MFFADQSFGGNFLKYLKLKVLVMDSLSFFEFSQYFNKNTICAGMALAGIVNSLCILVRNWCP